MAIGLNFQRVKWDLMLLVNLIVKIQIVRNGFEHTGVLIYAWGSGNEGRLFGTCVGCSFLTPAWSMLSCFGWEERSGAGSVEWLGRRACASMPLGLTPILTRARITSATIVSVRPATSAYVRQLMPSSRMT